MTITRPAVLCLTQAVDWNKQIMAQIFELRVSGKGGAADILGINPKTLESRMQRPGIQRNKPH